METSQTKWICAQLGAREHYAIPRALHAEGLLAGLFTDAWVEPGNPLGLLKRSLRERYHAELADAAVLSANVPLLAFEAGARVKGWTGWNRIMARNEWFQRQILKKLKTEMLKAALGQRDSGQRDDGQRGAEGGELTKAESGKQKAEKLKSGDTSPGAHLIRPAATFSPERRRESPQSGEEVNFQHSTRNSQPILFSYSYTALELFRFAKSRGWKTVLGQIDAGPEMGRIVHRLEQQHPEYQSRSDAPPKNYWEAWRDECALADRIVVNSEWSRQALEWEGIRAGKIRVVPLAYVPPSEAAAFRREYPPAFSLQRPMRVLFLGQINPAKGLAPLLEAAEILRGEPVEFRMVGPVQVAVPEKWRRHPQIRWIGPVPRGTVAEHYRTADVFVFPTFSDGFGLTQLEAQAWKLPVIASRFCGDVVEDGVNGLQLAGVSGTSIAHALRSLLAAPGKLSDMAQASGVGPQFSLAGIAGRILTLFS